MVLLDFPSLLVVTESIVEMEHLATASIALSNVVDLSISMPVFTNYIVTYFPSSLSRMSAQWLKNHPLMGHLAK
jgi:hypothetical protein